ncbi:MAG: outer membrane protein assembly factor BamE [Myxococcaceae bacterium]|nr:outer membrane protein assembly factor BamE [Myxococcaceae bacterium]
MTSSTVAAQATPVAGELFSAFREERASSRRWLLVLVVPLLGALAAWASMDPGVVRIVTPSGIQAVNPGMSQQEVLRLLGTPIGRETRADGLQCFQHGYFALTEPMTTVHTLCYEGGKLKDVTTRRFSLWRVDPSGAFVPAGIPFDDEPATP